MHKTTKRIDIYAVCELATIPAKIPAIFTLIGKRLNWMRFCGCNQIFAIFVEDRPPPQFW
jgi:hypothetical protein